MFPYVFTEYWLPFLYWLSLVALTFIASPTNPGNKIILFGQISASLFVVLIFFIYAGLAPGSAPDKYSYIGFYEYYLRLGLHHPGTNGSAAYQWFVELIAFFELPSEIFYKITVLIVFVLFALAGYKTVGRSGFPLFLLSVLISSNLVNEMVNTQQQGLMVGFFILGIIFSMEKRKIGAFLFIVTAIAMHWVSLMVLALIVMSQVLRRIRFDAWILFFISFFIYLTNVFLLKVQAEAYIVEVLVQPLIAALSLTTGIDHNLDYYISKSIAYSFHGRLISSFYLVFTSVLIAFFFFLKPRGGFLRNDFFLYMYSFLILVSGLMAVNVIAYRMEMMASIFGIIVFVKLALELRNNYFKYMLITSFLLTIQALSFWRNGIHYSLYPV